MRLTTCVTLAGMFAFLGSAREPEVPPQIVGSWTYSESSTVPSGDRSNGAFAKISGSSESLSIHPDGSFEQEILLQQSQHSCSTTLLLKVAGHVQVDGRRISFQREAGHLSSKDTCQERFNCEKEATREVKSYDEWDLQNSPNGPQLLLSEGKLKYRYGRKS